MGRAGSLQLFETAQKPSVFSRSGGCFSGPSQPLSHWTRSGERRSAARTLREAQFEAHGVQRGNAENVHVSRQSGHMQCGDRIDFEPVGVTAIGDASHCGKFSLSASFSKATRVLLFRRKWRQELLWCGCAEAGTLPPCRGYHCKSAVRWRRPSRGIIGEVPFSFGSKNACGRHTVRSVERRNLGTMWSPDMRLWTSRLCIHRTELLALPTRSAAMFGPCDLPPPRDRDGMDSTEDST